MDKFRNDTRINPDSSTMKTADQTLSPPIKIKLNKNSTIEEVRQKLIQEDPSYYKEFPEELKGDAEHELRGLKENRETFTLEDIKKLGTPVKPVPQILETPKDLSKKEKRKEKKESKKLKKEDDLLKKSPNKESKTTEDKIKTEEKIGEEKEPILIEKGKSFLKEKGTLEKGKNLLLSQGTNLPSGKSSMGDVSSLLRDKNQLAGKGIEVATSLLSNKSLREKGMKKLKSIGKKKEELQEKSTITTETPELKKPTPEIKKEEVKKEETPQPIKETPKKEKPEEPPKEKKEPEQTAPSKESKSSSSVASSGIPSQDLNDIKSLLGRIASLLEGPLSIESNDSPFRPDSRRF